MRLLGLLLAALLAGGCSERAAPFNAIDIAGADYARGFSLVDADGRRRSLAEFRGRLVAVFFGYAQCPDVCPTTLADFAQVRQRLGKDAQRLQVVFITLDPARDTPAVLASYAANFDPGFIALTGTDAEIDAAAREFKVFHQKVTGRTPTSYTIDHTAGTYVFDRDGRVRLFVKYPADVEAIVADLKRLL